MDSNFWIKVAIADSVISRVVAAKKVWNVEVTVQTTAFNALHADIKETATEEDCCEDAYGNGVVHNWSVGLLAKPGRKLIGQLPHQPQFMIVDSFAEVNSRADAGRASGKVLGGEIHLYRDAVAVGHESA